MNDDTITATFHRPPDDDIVLIAIDHKGNYTALDITRQALDRADRNALALILEHIVAKLEALT